MRERRFILWAVVWLTWTMGVALSSASQPVVGVYSIQRGDSLSALAQQHYGSALDWPAIMFATHRRLSEGHGLAFIGSPNVLQPGHKVWIPVEAEKQVLMQLYKAYVESIQRSSLPQSYRISNRLRRIVSDAPVTVVTWAREGQYPELGDWTTSGNVWVTVVPEMKDFCQSLGLDLEALTLRLEQRLGLPPMSNKTLFVELQVDNPQQSMFRPCPDPRITTTTCPVRFPDHVDETHKNWIQAQYYSAFATAQPSRFPWTALGYTYDWGDPTSRIGASEFIIRQGTRVRILTLTPTQEYCSVN